MICEPFDSSALEIPQVFGEHTSPSEECQNPDRYFLNQPSGRYLDESLLEPSKKKNEIGKILGRLALLK
jgi:hypothetical protein